ncbi:MAG: CHAT domain-containing protein, partial [bacterium]
ESLASADDIYITEDMYKAAKGYDDFIFRYVDTTQVKGKKEALKVYRVLWHEESLSLGKTRSPLHKTSGLFVLEVFRYGQKLKVSGFERKGEERPVTGYKEIKFNETKIKKYTKGIIDLLNRANRRGKIGGDLLIKLKDYGKLLCDELVPPSIKEQIIKTNEKNLMISIDDELVYIPWELLYDGKNFFCQRFSMGRSVKTQQQVSVVSRALARPLKMQLLVDPSGDLKAAYEEGVEVKNEIGLLEDWINVSFKSTDIRTDYVKARIRNFDIVHYAGHAEHDAQSPEKSGWMLSDGKLSAEDIINLKGAMPMPSLVFSNACQSGQTDEWKIEEDCENRIYGLANAFLLAGVQHYIGTFWEIPDQAGSYFATHFYKCILRGDSIGEAVRVARMELINRYGEDTIVWASYMLYGDPATTYVHPLMGERKEEPEKKVVKEELVATELRHREQVINLNQDRKKSKNMIYAGIAFLIMAAIVLFIIQKGMTPGVREQTVAVPVSKESQAVVGDAGQGWTA